MKRLLSIFAAIPLLFSCNPENASSEEKNNPKELIVTAEASEIEYTSATLSGYANFSEGMTGITFGIIISRDENPTVDNGRVVQSIELNSYNKFYCKITDLIVETTYYYKAYLKEGDFYHTGSKTLSFTTKDYPYSAQAIDLGLSVKWALCNLGASKPEEYGFYFAWGETKPKEVYLWDTYKWGVYYNSFQLLTKYCTDSNRGYNGFVDGKTVLDLEDDVAHVKLGGKWRMPTDEEWRELRRNCTLRWDMMNGISGMRVISPNGNSIFLPEAGHCFSTNRSNVPSQGDYWSSSLIYSGFAYRANLISGSMSITGTYCESGLSVRPVSE